MSYANSKVKILLRVTLSFVMALLLTGEATLPASAEPDAPRGAVGSIYGTVNMPEGEPETGPDGKPAPAWAEISPDGQRVPLGKDGRFEFARVPLGEHELSVFAGTKNAPVTYFPGTANRQNGQKVKVLGNTRVGVQFSALRAPAISGWVVVPRGVDVAQLAVTATGPGGRSLSRPVQSDGRYRLGDIPGTGEWRVSLKGPGVPETRFPHPLEMNPLWDYSCVELRVGGASAPAPRTATISGTVKLAPGVPRTDSNGDKVAPSVAIGGPAWRQAALAADGRFEFKELPLGEYAISASNATQGAPLTTFPGYVNSLGKEKVRLSVPGVRAEVRFANHRARTVSGRVVVARNPQKAPLANLYVGMKYIGEPVPRGPQMVRADLKPDGTFAITEAPTFDSQWIINVRDSTTMSTWFEGLVIPDSRYPRVLEMNGYQDYTGLLMELWPA